MYNLKDGSTNNKLHVGNFHMWISSQFLAYFCTMDAHSISLYYIFHQKLKSLVHQPIINIQLAQPSLLPQERPHLNIKLSTLSLSLTHIQNKKKNYLLSPTILSGTLWSSVVTIPKPACGPGFWGCMFGSCCMPNWRLILAAASWAARAASVFCPYLGKELMYWWIHQAWTRTQQ